MFWIYFINNSILLTLFYWYNRKLFKKSKLKVNIIFLIIILIIIKSMFNLFAYFQINFAVTILTYFGLSYIFFEGALVKKAIFIGFFIIASFISEISTYVFLVPHLDTNLILNNSLQYLFIGNVMSGFLLFLITFIITTTRGIKDTIENNDTWYFIAFPVISVIIIYSIMHSNLLIIDPTLCILISFGIIIFNIVICFGFSDLIKSKNIQIDNEKLKNQKLHYLLLEERIDNTKQFIHDFRKHINIINGYVNSNQIMKLKSYLSELSTEMQANEIFVITGNQLIDLSLNSNKNILLKNSIDIKYDVRIKDICPISEFDFNIVFSNILDNAIESCKRTTNRFIKIKLDKKNNIIILKVINSCEKINKDYISLKDDKENHGYGLKSIMRIAKKYNGTSIFKFDEDKHVFISTIIFECGIEHNI